MATSVVTMAELWQGAAKHADPTAKRRLWNDFLLPYDVYAFDRASAEQHGELRYRLRHAPIGERDLLIAAVAMANNLTLVTANTREFERVPGLRVEDWSR